MEVFSRRAAQTAIDLTFPLPWAPQHQDEALKVGSGDYLRKFSDQAKIKTHAPAVESAGVPHSFLRPSRFFAREVRPSLRWEGVSGRV